MNILQSKIIPTSPGVYHFIGADGVVLYVGKAKNLKNRLRQYFLKELGRGPAIEQMVTLAQDIRYIETDSEIEAVLLESELIKKLRPKYNIRLKDDKSFLVIKITKEDFPVVELARLKNVDLTDKKADYFGPYPAGMLLKRSLQYLRKIFPYRDCSATKWRTYSKKGRTCIYGDIRVCTGPCNAWVNKTRYNQNIGYLKNFLRGKKKNVISDLEKRMQELSKDKKFEEAALLRNQLQALSHLKDVAIGLRDDVFSSRDILFKRIECYDISNIGEKFAVGSMVVFTNGKADKDEYRKFRIRNNELEIKGELNNDLSRLKQVLERRFKNDWLNPDLVVVDGGEMQLKIAKKVLEDANLIIPLISISKGPKRKKNDFHYSDSNTAKYFAGDKVLQNIVITARDESHRFAIEYYRTLHRKSVIES